MTSLKIAVLSVTNSGAISSLLNGYKNQCHAVRPAFCKDKRFLFVKLAWKHP